MALFGIMVALVLGPALAKVDRVSTWPIAAMVVLVSWWITNRNGNKPKQS